MKEKNNRMPGGNNQQLSGDFEMAAQILSNLAIENIFLSPRTLQGMLQKEFHLKNSQIEVLVSIFGRNSDGENPR